VGDFDEERGIKKSPRTNATPTRESQRGSFKGYQFCDALAVGNAAASYPVKSREPAIGRSNLALLKQTARCYVKRAVYYA
jgi:hypothetical protein